MSKNTQEMPASGPSNKLKKVWAEIVGLNAICVSSNGKTYSYYYITLKTP